MNTECAVEKWRVEANGQVFETNLDEMAAWIGEGALLRHDRVQKGDLRWIEAGKVPLLISFFEAKEQGRPVSPAELASAPLLSAMPDHPPATASETECCIHGEFPAAYRCGTCSSLFCEACPTSYGGTVKLCPYCGAIYHELSKGVDTIGRPVINVNANRGAFGTSDLVHALAYPFRFKTSLVLGTLMFAFFSVGSSILGFGGVFMISSAIACWMLANTLTFGILSNTVESMAAGRIGLNFMPTFEDFSAWDDVFQPFFLMIGVYVSSFGPLAAVVAIALMTASGPAVVDGSRTDQIQTANTASAPELPYAAGAAEQSQRVRDLLKTTAEEQRVRAESIDKGVVPTSAANVQPELRPGEFDADRLNKMIADTQKAQLESAVGESPETASAHRTAMFERVANSGILLLLFGFATVLWAGFYFPAACAVAGYTRSFAAVINPSVGIDTIRRLGVDYLKLLSFSVIIGIVFLIAASISHAMLSAFDLPGLGNLPATMVDSVFSFYLYIVFAVVIGSALYKAASRLDLPEA